MRNIGNWPDPMWLPQRVVELLLPPDLVARDGAPMGDPTWDAT